MTLAAPPPWYAPGVRAAAVGRGSSADATPGRASCASSCCAPASSQPIRCLNLRDGVEAGSREPHHDASSSASATDGVRCTGSNAEAGVDSNCGWRGGVRRPSPGDPGSPTADGGAFALAFASPSRTPLVARADFPAPPPPEDSFAPLPVLRPRARQPCPCPPSEAACALHQRQRRRQQRQQQQQQQGRRRQQQPAVEIWRRTPPRPAGGSRCSCGERHPSRRCRSSSSSSSSGSSSSMPMSLPPPECASPPCAPAARVSLARLATSSAAATMRRSAASRPRL